MTREAGAADFTKTVQVGQSISFFYRVNICANTVSKCQGAPGTVTETLKIPAGRTCRVLGRLSGATFSLLELPESPDNPYGEGIRLTYSNGDICDPVQRSTRSVIVNMECSRSDESSGTLLDMKKDDTCTTTFSMKSQHACATSSGSLAGGFLVIFFVAMAVYCVGGAVFNYRQKGARGREMIPHLELWQEFPSLVQDGVRYTLESGNRAYVDLKARRAGVDTY
jgi:hypothetical protein